MNGFIDIHTHILAEADDGAKDISESLALLRKAWENNTRAIVLTPHYRNQYKKSPQELRLEYQRLREIAKESLPDMHLYLGNEIACEIDIPEALAAGNVLTMNDSQYVLLELHAIGLRSQVISAVSELVRYGFCPIIAHVERYKLFRSDMTLIDELLQMGALFQLNGDSVLGKCGFATKRFCHKLLRTGKVQFIASDAHDMNNRSPQLRECFVHIRKKYGQEYAAALFYKNAQAVIENRAIY